MGGVPEILDADTTNWLVPDREVTSWIRAISALLDKPPTPESVRQRALRFGWDEVVARQCALYERVVSTYGATTRGAYA